MFLDMVGVVQSGVEKSIKRLGRNGITLLNLVIPKPEIPSDIAANYKQAWIELLFEHPFITISILGQSSMDRAAGRNSAAKN